MKKFSDITPQAIVDDAYTEYLKVDALLGYPKRGLPGSRQWYTDCNTDPPTFHVMRLCRKIGALEKLEAVIDRLDPFFIAVEYFTGKVQLQRTEGTELQKPFVDKFFCLILADSFRSSVDIYAKFLGWFFDLKGKETLGFGYEQLIVPLRRHSSQLADQCDALRTSPNFKLLKSVRDVEKHEGHGKLRVAMEGSTKSFTIEIKQPESINVLDIEHAACTSLDALLSLLRSTSDELAHWPLGYYSPQDNVVEIDDEGYLRMPSESPTVE